MSLTGLKETDRLILQNLEDDALLEIMTTNKYLNSLLDENFWRNRVLRKYPSTFPNKPEDKTWKEYYKTLKFFAERVKDRNSVYPFFITEALANLLNAFGFDEFKQFFDNRILSANMLFNLLLIHSNEGKEKFTSNFDRDFGNFSRYIKDIVPEETLDQAHLSYLQNLNVTSALSTVQDSLEEIIEILSKRNYNLFQKN